MLKGGNRGNLEGGNHKGSEIYNFSASTHPPKCQEIDSV